jgi:hypothetical protein
MKTASTSVPDIFRKHQATERTYLLLLDVLGKLLGVKIEEKKTCVHAVAGKVAFLGVHPRKHGLRLTIKLDRHLPEAVKSDQASKFRFHNEVDVSDEVVTKQGFRPLGGAVRNWIEEAYRLEFG